MKVCSELEFEKLGSKATLWAANADGWWSEVTKGTLVDYHDPGAPVDMNFKLATWFYAGINAVAAAKAFLLSRGHRFQVLHDLDEDCLVLLSSYESATYLSLKRRMLTD